MKKLLLVAALCLSVFAVAAVRTPRYDDANAKVESVLFVPLADGGCAYRVCASVASDDGGHPPWVGCVNEEVTNSAARTRCLNVMDDVLTRWKARGGQ
jgi:hypothetical protein